MTDHEVHEIILAQACRDIESYAEKIKKGQAPNPQDYEMLDKLYHLKKDMLACKGMEDAEMSEENGNLSGRRGRGMNGQYVSRDMSNRQSYDEGYSRGYQDGQTQSGHWPTPPYRPMNW